MAIMNRLMEGMKKGMSELFPMLHRHRLCSNINGTFRKVIHRKEGQAEGRKAVVVGTHDT